MRQCHRQVAEKIKTISLLRTKASYLVTWSIFATTHDRSRPGQRLPRKHTRETKSSFSRRPVCRVDENNKKSENRSSTAVSHRRGTISGPALNLKLVDTFDALSALRTRALLLAVSTQKGSVRASAHEGTRRRETHRLGARTVKTIVR